MRKLFVLLPFIVLFAACQTETPADVALEATADYDTYGTALTPEGAVSVQTVLAEPDRYTGQTVKLEGRVSEVCQMRGCWATLVTDAGTVRIQMPRLEDDSDYVFTLPKDISGRFVVATGTLEAHTIPADEQRHYDEDAGVAKDASAYQDKIELRLKPTGVLVQKS